MRLLCATIAACALAATAAGATAVPRIGLLGSTPLTVAGAGFGSKTAVHVSIGIGSTRLAKTVESTSAGRFVAHFRRSVPDTSCIQVTIAAATVRTRLVKKIVPAGEACGAQHVTSDPGPAPRP